MDISQEIFKMHKILKNIENWLNQPFPILSTICLYRICWCVFRHTPCDFRLILQYLYFLMPRVFSCVRSLNCDCYCLDTFVCKTCEFRIENCWIWSALWPIWLQFPLYWDCCSLSDSHSLNIITHICVWIRCVLFSSSRTQIQFNSSYITLYTWIMNDAHAVRTYY